MIRRGGTGAALAGLLIVCLGRHTADAQTGLREQDRECARRAATQYIQASIRGDTDAMYDMMSSIYTKVVTRDAFRSMIDRQRRSATRTGIVFVGRPVVRGRGLLSVNVEYRVTLRRGPNAGREGMTATALWARLENGRWRIVDTQGVDSRVRAIISREDLGQIGEGLAGPLMGFQSWVQPYVDTSHLLKIDSAEAVGSFAEWSAGEMERLKGYGDFLGPPPGEVIAYDGSQLRVRFGMILATIQGKRIESRYYADLRRVRPRQADVKWLLIRISSLGITPCHPDPQLDSCAAVWASERVRLETLVNRRLHDWTVAKLGGRDCITDMMNSGIRLKEFGPVKVLSIHSLYLHPLAATAIASVDLHYTKDAPPNTRSGRHAITLEQTGATDGRWAIVAIRADGSIRR